jgi:putative inorganic carbon (HCO3(-)) transporter
MPPIRDIVVLAIILGSLPICFLRPFYGIGLWTVVAFMNPHRMSWGVARDFPVAELIAVATLLGFLIFEHKLANLWRRESVLILLLWAWFAVDTAVTTHMAAFQHHAGLTMWRFGMVSKIILMTVVAIAVVNSWFRFRRFLLCIAGAFGFLVLKMLPWMIVTGGKFRAYGPDNTMIADNNDLGLALNMVFPIFFFLAKSESNPTVRKLFWFLSLITVPAIFFTWSRGALVGLVVVLGFIFLSSRQKLLLAPILLVAVTLGLFFTPATWRDRMTGIVADPADSSVRGRLNAWHFAVNLAMDYPLTGGGLGTFTPELFKIYAPAARNWHESHSIYFGMLGEQGFIGLGLYLALLVSCFVTLRRLKRHAYLMEDDQLFYYSKMLQTSLLAFAVCGAFLGRHYFDLFFDIVACVVMLKVAAENEANEQSEAATESSGEPEFAEVPPAGIRGLDAV